MRLLPAARSRRSRRRSATASGASGSCSGVVLAGRRRARRLGRGCRDRRSRHRVRRRARQSVSARRSSGRRSIALLPSLARTPKELIAANGATSTIESLGTLLGPLGAGRARRVRRRRRRLRGQRGGAPGSRPPCWRACRSRVASPRPRARRGSTSGRASGRSAKFRARGSSSGLIAAQTFVRGCLNVLIVVTAYQVLHEGATEVGYLTAAIGAGGLVGALGAVSLARRAARAAVRLGARLLGRPDHADRAAPLSRAGARSCSRSIGAANSVVDVAGFTLLQRTVPDDVLTRVLGVTWGLAMGAVAIGSFVAPAILSLIGLRPAFLVVGAILPRARPRHPPAADRDRLGGRARLAARPHRARRRCSPRSRWSPRSASPRTSSGSTSRPATS